jgi:hypothetical protein
MTRNSLAARAAALAGLLLLAGCSKEIDFSIPTTFTANATGGTPYTYLQQVDLSTQAADAWGHRDKVKDLSLVELEGVVQTVTAATTGSGTIAIRPDTATTSASDVTLGTYTNQSIAVGRSLTITLTSGAIDIINDALQGSGRFKVVLSGTTAATTTFTTQVTLHFKMNYKIIG